MRQMVLVMFLAMLIFIMGCSTEEQAVVVDENETLAEMEASPQGGQEEMDTPAPLPLGACDVGWKCISSLMKAYRNTSCGFGERVSCPLGCVNDTCKAASTCISGFKCINNHRRGYQTEACTWINDVECPGGCEEGECLFYNASAAQASEVEAEPTAEEPVAPVDDSSTLRMGQQETVEIGDEEHIISLYILEQSRVKFYVDGFKTNWLEEGDSSVVHGVTITVHEILFQSYSGGKQEVRYTIG